MVCVEVEVEVLGTGSHEAGEAHLGEMYAVCSLCSRNLSVNLLPCTETQRFSPGDLYDHCPILNRFFTAFFFLRFVVSYWSNCAVCPKL